MNKRRIEQEWLSLIEQCESSSLTRSAFCTTQYQFINVSCQAAKAEH
ncbi:hypothetical protein [Vibrio nitrifigilis]|uniref:Uncharacterized protein n=1 Tax=Vibrio nitrifigilis TaxID=2789781 RepID=A0ABS0GBN9_9VIBR|nr:hypothetical protein [Vibrio nitrifigilis]MBF8999693.1 hypothetical protein [Vibrio nitrifigilis]